MKYFEQDDSIECLHSSITAKRITPCAAQKHPKIGYCIRYICDRDGKACIEKELDPKEHLVKKTSKLNNGDSIRANKFDVLIKGMKQIKREKLGGESGRHNSQTFNSKTFTFAEITYPFSHIANALEFKKNLPEK